MRTYDFKEMKEIGKKGFEEVCEIMKSTNKIQTIIDLQDDLEFQEKDIDFKIIDSNEKEYLCELKTDRWGHNTGNLFIETTSNTNIQSDGNFIYTECDLFFYYLIKSRELYIFNQKEFKKWFEEKKEFLRKVTTATDSPMGVMYNTEGYLLPIFFLERSFNHYKKIKGVS